MAHLYASIQGNRGEVTRTGTKSSGIVGHIRGWKVGAEVVITREGGKDVVQVYKTGGSMGTEHTLIAEFTEDSFQTFGVCHD